MARPVRQQQVGTRLVRVYVSNGHRTSGGTGPGTFELPADEADRIVQARHGRILGPDEQPGEAAATRRHAHGVTN
jgi:hypothetical protein